MSSRLKELFGEGWYTLLESILSSPNFNELGTFIASRRKAFNVEVYPSQENIFRAFRETPLEELKVVLIGQDPYYTPGLAIGLAFGVPDQVKLPPSLVNILKEVEDDIYNGLDLHYDPSLEKWATQGVLLLNTALTVEKNKPESHTNQWKFFTQGVLEALSKQDNIIYVLWGNHAQQFKKLIMKNPTAFIIESPHPSPLSAYRGFFGSKPFSTINNQLLTLNKKPIQW
jgi:uracil-DNA glycosylase